MARVRYEEAVQLVTNYVSQNQPVSHNDMADHFNDKGQGQVINYVLQMDEGGIIRGRVVWVAPGQLELQYSLPEGGDA